MNTSKALEILSPIKNGTFGVVEYETEVPVNKVAKDSGIKIFCKTKKMVRFGADYKNLVKEVASAEVKPRKNNYTWVLKNKVAHNSNTEKDYIRISNINRKTISRSYRFVTPTSVTHADSLAGYEDFLRPASGGSFTRPVVQNISIENIISINGIN